MVAKKEMIGNSEYWKLLYFVYHQRSKNWVARLSDLDEKYKFKRDFLNFTDFDDRKYVELVEGGIYEFRHIYITTGGNEQVRFKGIYQLLNGELIEKTEKEAADILANLKNETESDATINLSEINNKKISKLKSLIEQSTNDKMKSMYKDHIALIIENEQLKKELEQLRSESK